MNISILKIVGLTIFILVAIVVVYVLWPAKSPDVGQTPQRDASTSAVQPSGENPQPKRQLEPQDFQQSATSRLQDQNPRQQELRDRAAHGSEQDAVQSGRRAGIGSATRGKLSQDLSGQRIELSTDVVAPGTADRVQGVVMNDELEVVIRVLPEYPTVFSGNGQ